MESLACSFNCASRGINAPFARTRSRHFGESPATLPNAQTALKLFSISIRINDSQQTLNQYNIKLVAKQVIKYLLTNVITARRKKLHKYWNCPMINDNLGIL